VLDIPAANAADESSGDDTEEGEDWLGSHNLGEYRSWRAGETDTIRHAGSGAAAEEEEEEEAKEEEVTSSSAPGPDVAMGAASARSAAAGDVVVQVGDILSLPFSLTCLAVLSLTRRRCLS
jgi:hypothetical protein